MNDSLSTDEHLRLADLLEYRILDTPPEKEFDDFTTLACFICNTPIAIITLLDKKRQWFKSRIGLEVSETPRDIAFCDHTVAIRNFFTVHDALHDPRFSANPLVLDTPHIRFYAGAPLTTPQGHVIGTLSVIDSKPRRLSHQQEQALRTLSRHVVVLLELRKNVAALKRVIAERNRAEQELRGIQAELETRVRERSAALEKINAALRSEITERVKERNVSDALINSLPGIFYVFDETGRYLRWNDNFQRVTGFSDAEMTRVHPLDLFDNEADRQFVTQKIADAFLTGQTQAEATLHTRNGKRIPYLFNAVRLEIDGRTCLSGMGLDITETRRHKEQLEHQASHDSLTQLANRALLNDRIELAVAAADRNHAMAVIAFIDLDNFKLVNDTLGHDVGDRLLVGVANRLKKCVREGDTVARHGGDEFVLVLQDQHGEDALAAWIGRLIERVSQPFPVGEHQLFITCSIGLSVYPRDGKDVQTLLKHADAAMYQAKAEGRNQFQFFIPSMNARIRERFMLEARLRGALEREEFLLYYQPQIDLASGRIVGAEALVRWQDPELGLMSPQRFIPVAEETGLIVPLGQWVLEQACMQNKALQSAGFAGLTVSVNLSPRQFLPEVLVRSVQSALQHAGLRAGLLKLEVTEGMVMSRPEEAEEILHEIKRMGVRLAIDDFGVGYSSLSYLKRFPVDQLKIDQSFVQRVAEDPDDAAITQAMITLGHNLNMNVIAEGVCTPKQLAFLRQHDCDEIQGNYFFPAMPFENLRSLLGQPQPLPH